MKGFNNLDNVKDLLKTGKSLNDAVDLATEQLKKAVPKLKTGLPDDEKEAFDEKIKELTDSLSASKMVKNMDGLNKIYRAWLK